MPVTVHCSFEEGKFVHVALPNPLLVFIFLLASCGDPVGRYAPNTYSSLEYRFLRPHCFGLSSLIQ
jgi:hypothetical protein